MTNEQEAIALGNNRMLLLKRLKEARAVLANSRSGSLAVPDSISRANDSSVQRSLLAVASQAEAERAEGYRNQQTNRGTVTLMLWRGPGGP